MLTAQATQHLLQGLIAQPGKKTFLKSEILHKALTHEDMGISNLEIIKNSNHDNQPSENSVHKCACPVARGKLLSSNAKQDHL